MISEISLAVAFTAGIVSFLAPCVLPLIPGYLAYLSGTNLTAANTNRKEIFLNSVFFVLGFSLVFASLGVLLNTILERIAFDVLIWLSRLGGLIIIFFGLYLIGLVKISYLEREHRIRVGNFRSRYFSSFVFGSAFAAGWTPCVGAALGAILGLAATEPGSAFALLLAYSFGFGLPFLIIGLFTTETSNLLRGVGRWVRYLNIIFGILLVFLGILIFTQTLNRIGNFELLNKVLGG